MVMQYNAKFKVKGSFPPFTVNLNRYPDSTTTAGQSWGTTLTLQNSGDEAAYIIDDGYYYCACAIDKNGSNTSKLIFAPTTTTTSTTTTTTSSPTKNFYVNFYGIKYGNNNNSNLYGKAYLMCKYGDEMICTFDLGTQCSYNFKIENGNYYFLLTDNSSYNGLFMCDTTSSIHVGPDFNTYCPFYINGPLYYQGFNNTLENRTRGCTDFSVTNSSNNTFFFNISHADICSNLPILKSS